jgi:hypothetical protein
MPTIIMKQNGAPVAPMHITNEYVEVGNVRVEYKDYFSESSSTIEIRDLGTGEFVLGGESGAYVATIRIPPASRIQEQFGEDNQDSEYTLDVDRNLITVELWPYFN